MMTKKMLKGVGSEGEPMATPSVCLQNFPSNISIFFCVTISISFSKFPTIHSRNQTVTSKQFITTLIQYFHSTENT